MESVKNARWPSGLSLIVRPVSRRSVRGRDARVAMLKLMPFSTASLSGFATASTPPEFVQPRILNALILSKLWPIPTNENQPTPAILPFQ